MAETVRKYSLAAVRHRVFVIAVAFALVLASLLTVFVITTSAVNAATYQSGTGGVVNWTAGASWTCVSAGPPGAVACGAYPGSTVTAGDVAKPTNASYFVNTSIPSAVTLDMSGAFGQSVGIQGGGVLGLTGNSVISSTSGSPNNIAIQGGTLANTGTLQIGGGINGGTLSFDGGAFNGAGITNVTTPGGIFTVTGTAGAMTLNGQLVNNTSSIGFSGGTLTMVGGATINNSNSFTVIGGSSIAGGGGGLVTNSGIMNNNGFPFTIGVPFSNTSTASAAITGATYSFTGGSGLGHNNATWTLAAPGGFMTFGGGHLFNGTQTFGGGIGTVNITGPFTVNTSTPSLAIGAGISVNNSTGTIGFGTTTHSLALAGGNYTQGAGGTLNVKLGPVNGTSDAVTINGSASLAGNLIPSFATGYTPANGDTFTVVTDTGSQTGTFTYTPLAYSNGFFQIVYNANSVQLVAVPQADISVTKTGPPSVPNGQNASYLITVTNLGPSAATGIQISDTFTPNATFVSATPSTGACLGTTSPITCTFPGLANGNSATVSLVLTANGTGTITNTAALSATAPLDPNSLNDTQTVNTTITPSADLSLGISGPPSASAASAVPFTATINNAGPDPAVNPTATFSLSSGAITSASGTGFTCSNTATTATCTATAPMPSSGSGTITIATTAPAQPGTMTLTGSVSSTTFDPALANNSSSASVAIVAVSDVSLTKTPNLPFIAGTNVTYNIVVSNAGPSDAPGVTVFDTPGAGLTFVSNSGACTTAFPCSLATIPAGGSVTIVSTFALASNATGTVTNSATATATGDPTPGNNSSGAVSAAVTTNSDVAVTKSISTPVTPGGNATFTVTVKNFGPSDATGVVVTDVPGPGLTFVSNSGGCSSAYPCTLGTMTPGQIITINSTFAVASGATGTVTNTASVSSTSSDPLPSNNSSTVSPAVSSIADLSITKAGPPALPTTGSVTFTITVKNLGPSSATNVMVSDAASRLVFVSNGGACSTPFPCSLGTLAAGATATITSTFTVTPGAQFASNSATVSSSDFDPASSNNTSSVTLGQSCPNITPGIISPTSGQSDVPVSGTISWSSASASSYEVYLGKAGTGCNTLVATVGGTSFAYSGLDPNTDYEVRVVALRFGCPSLSSQCVRFRTGQGACTLAAPVLQSPVGSTNVPSPVKLQWGSVPGAESYHVVVSLNGNKIVDTTTTDTFLDVTIDNGGVSWSVTAISGNCSSPTATATFNVCSSPAAPRAGVVGAPSAGRTYQVIDVDPSPNVVLREFQEADNDAFRNATSQTTPSASMSYSHLPVVQAQVFFYRVRAFSACSSTPGPFSKVLRVVLVPAVVTTRPVVNVPAGSKEEVILKIFIPGESERVAFSATSDRPWITRIDPSSGILPMEGITLTLHIDPSQLPNGTFTATVIIAISPLTDSRITTQGNTSKSSPVTINLVTPVVPVDAGSASDDSFIVPAVGRLVGLNSQWRSDVRIFNPSSQAMTYTLNFLAAGSSDVKQTTIQTDPGATTALDDLIHNWYGVGEVGDSATGVLQVVPVKSSGQSALASIVASRTYSIAGEGTLGEFIPGIPLKQFIGAGNRLSLQQIAQTSNYRTNFGLVEASGKPASVVLSMFNSAGSKLFDLPVTLAANEQKLLNGLLTQQGITSLTDGRMEVRVTGGDGKITAYASVIDNASENPLFVPGSTLGTGTAQLYVVPGVADLNNGAASWRSDVRIFNAGSATQSAELAYYPTGAGALPFFATVSINTGEVKVLDNILQTTFGLSNTGGAVHVNTSNNSQLIITARTYNQTADGTLGQFVPGATLNDAINKAGQALNILQVEDSVRYRTNVGLAEMTGKPATVEISVILPDSKVTPTIEVPLAANEFRQFGLAEFGLGSVYNARVSVRVVGGDGSVTAYGSVIDQITTAPTYVAAK
ncbi:MAG TPA: hypothetical protein VLV78_17370 [Thermoanaerobaculia bacterium]|nr:hypothetical protein [Thermoanaerobaculia bacterium]